MSAWERSFVTRATALVAIGAFVAACSAILGIDDRSLDPTLDAGLDAPSPDGPQGGAGGDASSETSSDAPVETGPCGDTQTSSTNCGRCGHDCLGGQCVAGVCQPVVLVKTQRPWGIAVDANHVYWTNFVDDLVMQADKADGNNQVTLVSGFNNFAPLGIAVDSANVYFTNVYGVFSCTIGGCANTPTTVAGLADASLGTPRYVALDNTDVYWSENDSNFSALRKAAKGANTTIFTLSDDAGGPELVAVDSQNLYWTADDGVVRVVPIDGGAVTALNGSNPPPTSAGLAIDTNNVYWSVLNNPGSVNEVSKSGTNQNPIAGGQNFPFGVAVDASHIYWVDQGDLQSSNGTIMSCAFASCASPSTLATGQNVPKMIAVDANAIYWTNSGNGTDDGTVVKLAKP